MPHVMAGRVGKDMRRKSAYERLGVHLRDHKQNYFGDNFESHDATQKAEYVHLGELINGKY